MVKIGFKIVFKSVELITEPSPADEFLEEQGVSSWKEAYKKGVADKILEDIEEYEGEYTGNAMNNMSFKLGKFYLYRDYLELNLPSGLLHVSEVSEFYAEPTTYLEGKKKYPGYRIITTVTLTSDAIYVTEEELQKYFGLTLQRLRKAKPKLMQITFTFTTDFTDSSLKKADKKAKIIFG